MSGIRPMVAADWPVVREIYADGIATGQATFESEPPRGWEQFDDGHTPEPRLVAVDDDGRVVAWAAASPVSNRLVYRGVIEHSVYVAADVRGTGVGRILLAAFLAAADEAGLWTIQSSVFPENVTSLRLHEAAGFRVVGRRERIGHMSHGPEAGTWRDTILIERRSSVNGATP